MHITAQLDPAILKSFMLLLWILPIFEIMSLVCLCVVRARVCCTTVLDTMCVVITFVRIGIQTDLIVSRA